MRKLAGLLMVSILGGIITLGSYLLLFQQEKIITVVEPVDKISIFKTSNTSENSFEVEDKVDFKKAARETVDAVVHVKNTSIKTVRDPFAELYYGRSSGRQYAQVGTGSGVVISSDGYIITNNHVINGASNIEITLNNKRTYEAILIGADTKSDIALLKIDADELPFVAFGDSDNIQIGEWVLAVGNPYSLTSTVTAGIISAKGRDLEGNDIRESFIQTDAAVNPGNSGGALVNTKGELIGINTAISSKTGSFIGYSFAVPSNIAKKVIEDLLVYGNVQQAILGVNGGELNSNIANKLDIAIAQGFLISHVVEDSGASKAGIKKGDVITKLDKVNIKSYSDLSGFINSKQPDDIITVTVMRHGVEVEMIVTLSKKEFSETKLGFNLKNLTEEELAHYKLSHGVIISDITNKELLQFGVKEGFVVTKINGKLIQSANDLESIIASDFGKKVIRLEMLNLDGDLERYIFN